MAVPDDPRPPFKPQQQSFPGKTARMEPEPDHGEESYVGHGLLKAYQFPPPSKIARGFVELSLTGFPTGVSLWTHTGVTIWRVLQGYVAAIPAELEEAGEMDGASRLTILRTIILPLLAPGLVATAMFTFVSAWNEFFLALVLLQSPELYTLPIALRSFLGAEGQTQLGPLAAGAILATIPSLIIFGILQKKLTGGMLAGAVKG